jgi:ribosome assembly protein YihI (activator of Der GTPase)
MVRPCSENGRRKITQNSIEVDAETKESTRKTKKRNWKEGTRKAMNERNLNEGKWEDRKQWSLGVGQRRKTF